MPPVDLSTGKGGKNRRRGKNENENDKRELIFKEDGQEYAQVIKMLGNGRLEAYCFDGIQRLCHIRGKLRKKVRQVMCHYSNYWEALIMWVSKLNSNYVTLFSFLFESVPKNVYFCGNRTENSKIYLGSADS